MAPAVDALSSALAGLDFADADVPVIPNVTAEPTRDGGELKSLLTRQIVSPVRWTDSMRRLTADGCDRALEVGPGTTLQGLMKRIDRSVVVAPAGSVDEIASLT
jgi:[acyl-carrier-protein] S-malonyltransferase